MGEIVQSEYVQQVQKAVWDSFAAMFQLCSEESLDSSAEYVEAQDAIRYISGLPHPIFNGVIQKKPPTAATVHSHMQVLCQPHMPGQLPFSWWIDPQLHTAEVQQICKEANLVAAGTYTGIAARVKRFPLWAQAEIEVSEISSDEEFALWGTVLGRVFGFDEPFLECLLPMLRNFGPGEPLRHYLARLHGIPVGTMSLFFQEGICSIWNGAVLPEARRQGVGQALGITCMNGAEQLGYSCIVGTLMAGKMAQSLVDRLGFQEVCHMVVYVHGFDPDEVEPTKPSAE